MPLAAWLQLPGLIVVEAAGLYAGIRFFLVFRTGETRFPRVPIVLRRNDQPIRFWLVVCLTYVVLGTLASGALVGWVSYLAGRYR